MAAAASAVPVCSQSRTIQSGVLVVCRRRCMCQDVPRRRPVAVADRRGHLSSLDPTTPANRSSLEHPSSVRQRVPCPVSSVGTLIISLNLRLPSQTQDVTVLAKRSSPRTAFPKRSGGTPWNLVTQSLNEAFVDSADFAIPGTQITMSV